jgi:hypothetical protein
MKGDLAVDHLLLALTYSRHVSPNEADRSAELLSMFDLMRDLRAPKNIFAGQTRNSGAGSSDPAALYSGHFLSGPREMPCQQLAALAASKDYGLEMFLLRH